MVVPGGKARNLLIDRERDGARGPVLLGENFRMPGAERPVHLFVEADALYYDYVYINLL